MSPTAEKPSILFVCLGNICRSPIAEGVMRANWGEKFGTIDSAGTAGYHIGEPPDPRMIATARRHGIDISNLRGRRIEDEDLTRFDHIVAMDHSNLREIEVKARLHPSATAKIALFVPKGDVPDPYFGGEEGFENVFRIVESGCEAIVRKLKL